MILVKYLLIFDYINFWFYHQNLSAFILPMEEALEPVVVILYAFLAMGVVLPDFLQDCFFFFAFSVVELMAKLFLSIVSLDISCVFCRAAWKSP